MILRGICLQIKTDGDGGNSRLRINSAFSNQKAINEIGKLQREIQAGGGGPTPE